MSELDYMLVYVQLCQEGIDSQCFKSAWLAVITPAVYGGNDIHYNRMATQELLFQCRNGHTSVYVPGVGRENLKVREGIRSWSIHGALFVKKNKNINSCQAERSHNM